jgi:hypothetical protein
MDKLIFEWRRFLHERQAAADVQYQSYQQLVKIKALKTDAGDKYELLGKIRSITGVTVVSFVPGTGREDATSYYDTVRIKFCCSRPIKISPRSFRNKILPVELNKIEGVTVQELVGDVEMIDL